MEEGLDRARRFFLTLDPGHWSIEEPLRSVLFVRPLGSCDARVDKMGVRLIDGGLTATETEAG